MVIFIKKEIRNVIMIGIFILPIIGNMGSNQLLVLSKDVEVTSGWMYLTGYLPYKGSNETHRFPSPITSLLILGFFWEGPYTELEVQIWLVDILMDYEHWAAGEQGDLYHIGIIHMP
ncbi:MAG: hypothetical protein QXO74_02965 [Candidatus Methanomethylicia archaeon]